MMHLRTCLAALVLGACASAHASVVTFAGDPAKTFADGTFSWHTDDQNYDVGFYPLAAENHGRALNSSGTGESIFFTNPVFFNSLTFENPMEAINPTSITVSLYDAHANLLARDGFAINPRFPFFPDLTLNFDVAGVSTAAITLTVDPDFGNYATFIVKDIRYDEAPAGTVPEPASLALLGLGAAAIAAVLRRTSA